MFVPIPILILIRVLTPMTVIYLLVHFVSSSLDSISCFVPEENVR
jgi:hypothetical protein